MNQINTTGLLIKNHEIQSYFDYFDPRFPRWLTIVLLFIGIFGIVLSLIVFCHESMKKNSVFKYLAYLSIVDLFVCVLGLGDMIAISYLKFIIRNYSIVFCRLHTFFLYSFTHLSSFILSAVSIDRAISLNCFTFAKTYCKPAMARKIFLLISLLTIVVNFHSLIFLGNYEADETVNNNNITNKSAGPSRFSCSSKLGSVYDKFLIPYFQYIDMLSYVIVPFFIMMICTLFIVKVLITTNKKNKHVKGNTKKTIRAPSEEPSGTINTNNQQLRAEKGTLLRNKKRTSRNKNITWTLISLNTLFFCLLSPLLFVQAFMSHYMDKNKMLTNIIYLLAYSNHCFNFVFYGLSSPPYRKAFKKIFGCDKSND